MKLREFVGILDTEMENGKGDFELLFANEYSLCSRQTMGGYMVDLDKQELMVVVKYLPLQQSDIEFLDNEIFHNKKEA